MSQEQPHYDVRMEADIQELGLTAPRITPDRIDALMEKVQYDIHYVPDSTTTVVTSYIELGAIKFTLAVVTLACVDKRNFSAELGRKYGIEKCKGPTKDKLWELEGYALAKQLAGLGQ